MYAVAVVDTALWDIKAKAVGLPFYQRVGGQSRTGVMVYSHANGRDTEETDAVVPHAYSFADGYLHPGEPPGHGVDIDEKLAAKYPYQRAYLPVNQLEDGMLFNW